MIKLDPIKLQKNIESTALDQINQKNMLGCSALVYQNGELLAEGYYGFAQNNTSSPITADSMYRMASMSKPITAVCILLEMQRHRLDINDNLSKYIPGFEHKYVGRIVNGKLVKDRPAATQIKLLHLLTHTSGLLSADEVALKQPLPQEHGTTLESCANYYANNILLSDSPFERSLYSGLAAFDVLSRVVEITSGMTFDEYVKKNICDVLDMSDTTFVPNDSQWNRLVAVHDKINGENVVRDFGKCTFENVPLTRFAGSCSIVSTLNDYAHFAQMLLHEGNYNGVQLIRSEYIRLMKTPHVPDTVAGIGPGETWGLGVRVIKQDEYLTKGTFGWSGAYGTHFFVDPTNRMYAIYLKNSYYNGGSGAETARLFERDVMTAIDC